MILVVTINGILLLVGLSSRHFIIYASIVYNEVGFHFVAHCVTMSNIVVYL
jgi:hypothetical protein